MNKKLRVIVLALVAVLALSGCTDQAAAYDKRVNQQYEFCVSHGGSWHLYGSDNSFTCTMPKVSS